MADSRLGDRIRNWLNGILESLKLNVIFANVYDKRAQWENIHTKGDLDAWIRKWGDRDVSAIAMKARQIGLSKEEIGDIVSFGLGRVAEDPSRWIAEQLQAATTSPMWQELNEMFGALVFDPWIASVTGGEISPDAPELESVRRFLGTQSTFEALGNVLNLLGEIISVGQVENAGKMFTDAKWLLGTCFTSWQTTSPIVESVILRPLQRLVNLTFRETDFTRAQWVDLYALGKLDASRLGAELGRLGFDSEKIAWLLELAKQQPSRSDLVGMWNKGIITDSLVAEGFRRLGYDQVWIDRFLRYYQKEETDDEKGAYIGTLRKAFKEQLVSEGDFREALQQQGRSDVAIDLEIAVLRLDWEVEGKTAVKADIKAAYLGDVIGQPEAERWLANADFTSDTIRLLIDTWNAQRAPTYRQINKSELLKAWGVGVLTQPETFQGLINVGYNEHGATVLMETYARSHLATKPPEVYRLRPQDIMWAWHTVVIEKEEALDRLAAIGLSEDDALLVFESFQRLHPRIVAKAPKELVKNDILEAWGRGVLDEDATFAKLLAIGYVETDADILMTSYAARPEALPPTPTIAALIESTRRGVINQAILSQKLTAMGLREEDVQFYVAYAVAPLPETTRTLTKTEITKLWVEGRHNRAWALERLLALKYAPEDAEDILWLASPEIEDTETYVLWKAGLIEDFVAEAMWSTMGFTEEQIRGVLAGE